MQVEVHQLKDGSNIMAFVGDYIGGVLRATGTYYERDMLKFIKENVQGGTFIDVGANIGNHTLFFGKYCNCHILAFEPFQPVFNTLKENMRSNKIVNCRLVRMALSDTVGKATMQINGKNLGMNKIINDINPNEATCQIETTTLDKYLNETHDVLQAPVSLIKLDCEGYEPNALRGMLNTIDTYKPVLFIECIDKAAQELVNAILQPLGYSAIKVFNATPTFLYVHSSQVKGK